jgi:hypothetical protein
MYIKGVRMKPSSKLKMRSKGRFSLCDTKMMIKTIIEAIANKIKTKMFEKKLMY